MNAQEFLGETIGCLDQSTLELLKLMLLDEYIQFSFMESEDITAVVLAEKLIDYFESVNLKTFRSFEDCISTYMETLASLVEPRIARVGQVEAGGRQGAGIPRARRYFDKFIQYRFSKDLTYLDIIDYSRIMLCLYESIMENGFDTIFNFDFSSDALDPVAIVEAMLAEEKRNLFPPFVTKRFNTSEPYGIDTCVIVITIVLMCAIIIIR